MATELVTVEQTKLVTAAKPRRRERTAEEIISAARTAPARSRAAWGLSLLTALMMWASFPPLDVGPLAYLAYVPLLMLVRPVQRPRWTYLAATVGGWLAFLALFQWMRLGDPLMYYAWAACGIYVGTYVPVFLWLCRTAVLRLHVPLVVAAPVLWTGLELVRAHLFTGQAWYLAGHTQYRWLELIQVSDLVGAYGVSFLVIAAAAVLAMLVPVRWYEWLRLVPAGVEPRLAIRTPSPRGQWIATAGVVAVFAASLTYGFVRRGQATWTQPDAKAGPRIGLVQGNFTARVNTPPGEGEQAYRAHLALSRMARKEGAEIVVWPEAMVYQPMMFADPNLSDADLERLAPGIPVEPWRVRDTRKTLTQHAAMLGAGMLVGTNAFTVDSEHGFRRYNSAALFHPSLGYQGRYDKIHRVPFGEYTPLQQELPFLARFSPFGFGGGLQKGDGPVAFEYAGYRLAPIICFESTVPHVVRHVLNGTRRDGQPADVLVTLSNDGWFHGSSGLDQHLATSAFRCVENRTPMACAVNTGISAFIDGDGAIVEPDVYLDADREGRDRRESFRGSFGRPHRQLNAVLVHDVPLDGRWSAYLAYGDWFALTCAGLAVFVGVLGLLPRGRLAAN
jgi:apolipoprotein N-acyltransferase